MMSVGDARLRLTIGVWAGLGFAASSAKVLGNVDHQQ
jgi:hypothetical protein